MRDLRRPLPLALLRLALLPRPFAPSARRGSALRPRGLSVGLAEGRALRPGPLIASPTCQGSTVWPESPHQPIGLQARLRIGIATAATIAHSTRLNGHNGAWSQRRITNAALHSSFVRPRTFNGRFHGSYWPWWTGGIVIGWLGPVFWPYAYDDFFDYIFWPYVYDDFWPYAYEDVYYGIYGGYAYVDPAARSGVRRTGQADPQQPVAGVCGTMRRSSRPGRSNAFPR